MRRGLKSDDVPKLGVPFSPNTASHQVVILFGVVGTVAKSPPISFVVSALLSACISLDTARQIGVRFDIGDSYENLSRKTKFVKIGQKCWALRLL